MKTGLLLSDDLIFTSRIVGTARDLGLAMKSAGSFAQLLALAHEEVPACVIVDLAVIPGQIAELVDWLRKNCAPPPRVVAYGSHVDVETLRKARAAGCDPVLPRSKFVEDLPRDLPGWMGVSSPETGS